MRQQPKQPPVAGRWSETNGVIIVNLPQVDPSNFTMRVNMKPTGPSTPKKRVPKTNVVKKEGCTSLPTLFPVILTSVLITIIILFIFRLLYRTRYLSCYDDDDLT